MSGVAVFAVGFVMLWNSLSRSGKVPATSGVPDIDYCSLGSDHTMCKYSGPDSGCTPGKLSNDERDELVSIHNEWRAFVASGAESRSSTKNGAQPPAANMLQMKYDEDIAKVAQRWAEQCTSGHDTNRNDKRFMSVGQNYAGEASTDQKFPFPLKQLVMHWYEEVALVDPAIVQKYVFDMSTGHYTQFVWHDTYLIGCGYASNIENKFKWYHLVCNYAPAGNVRDAEMYEIGKACSNCPKDHPTCYSSALCG